MRNQPHGRLRRVLKPPWNSYSPLGVLESVISTSGIRRMKSVENLKGREVSLGSNTRLPGRTPENSAGTLRQMAESTEHSEGGFRPQSSKRGTAAICKGS